MAAALALSPGAPLTRFVEHRPKQFLRTLDKTPSSRPEDAMERDEMSDSMNPRKIRGSQAHNLSARDLAGIVKDALRRSYANKKSAVKGVMEAAGCNVRAAENWWGGRNAPNGVYLLRLMAKVPALQAEVRRLTAMDSDLDPHFERAMAEAVALFQQLRGGK